MTMTHHSKPAEAVACLYTVQGDSQPFMRISRGMLAVAGDIVAVQPLGPLPATPAPGELDAVRGAQGFKAVSDDGKRWRIVPDEGDWEMQPVGHITAGEAKVICEGFVGLARERDRFLRLWNDERDRHAAALASPAATSALFEERKFSSDDVDFLNNEWWAAGFEAGKRSAETQGGDGVREAELSRLRFELANRVSARHEELMAEALAEIKASVDGDSEQPVRDIVYGLIAEIEALPKRAALAPSTSAATRGERVRGPVERDDGSDAWQHPAPAVESAPAKEAFFKGFSAGESYHNSKWHHYKAPDLNAAWGSYRASLATDAEG